MLTGKQLRDARNKREISAVNAAKRAGVSVNTIYAWENSKAVPQKNKAALQRLIAMLGFDIPETLMASLTGPGLKKATERSSVILPPAEKSFTIPPGTKQVLVVGGGGGGGGDKHGPADIAEFARLLGFFMGDAARRSTVSALLKSAIKSGLTIHGLERALDGNG